MRFAAGSLTSAQITDGVDDLPIVAAPSTIDETAAEHIKALAALYAFGAADLARLQLSENVGDAGANAINSLYTRARTEGWNGTAWDRISSEGNDRDAIAEGSLGNLQSLAFDHVYNGTTWDRVRSGGSSAPLIGSIKNTPILNPTLQEDETINDSDKTFTVPANTTWRVLFIGIEFTPTATVGNRRIDILFRDASDDVLLEIRSAILTPATHAVTIAFYNGAPRELTQTGSYFTNPLPVDIWLPAGFDIRVFDSQSVDAAADDMIVHMIVDERS